MCFFPFINQLLRILFLEQVKELRDSIDQALLSYEKNYEHVNMPALENSYAVVWYCFRSGRALDKKRYPILSHLDVRREIDLERRVISAFKERGYVLCRNERFFEYTFCYVLIRPVFS